MISGEIYMSSKRTVSAIPTHPEASVEEAKDWLTAEEFTHIEDAGHCAWRQDALGKAGIPAPGNTS